MKSILNLIKPLSLFVLIVFIVATVNAQVKKPVVSSQLKDFHQILKEANIEFNLPPGLRAIKAINNEDYSFDYAVELPGEDFEVWFQVKSQKQNWASYERAKGDQKRQLANPDALYLDIGRAHAIALTADGDYFVRDIPASVLNRYHADFGKSYLLNLVDSKATKHYKYALIISLQKAHTGTILMVCFTNEKGPQFYKNIDRASNCLKFKL